MEKMKNENNNTIQFLLLNHAQLTDCMELTDLNIAFYFRK